MNRERFQTIAIIFSFVINLILVLVVVVLATQIMAIKKQLLEPLVYGLDQSFANLGEATIDTTIPISQSLRVAFTQPVQFELPLDQETTVTTLTPTPINTTVRLSLGQYGQINAPVSLSLPTGTPLRVRLSMKIPVNTSINIDQQVPVLFNQRALIKLGPSGLDPVVSQLRGVVKPYVTMMQSLP
jgi:hypothetical protein